MDKTSAHEKGFPQMRSPNYTYRSRHQGSQDSNTLPSFDAPRMPASAVRSRTPVRAVFDDLSTAHSSITSRSGSGGHRTISANQSEDSIPLEDLKPRQGLLHQLPLPPLPAVLTTRDKFNRHPGVQFEPKQNFESDQRARGTQSEAGLVGEDRKEPSLPATRLYPTTYKIPSSPTKHWPRDSLELDNHSSPKRFNGRGKDRSSSQYPDTPPALKEVNHANARGIDEVLHDDEYDGGAPLQRFKPAPTIGHHLPRELSNTQTEQSSIPESSTIGKIYKSYVRSQGMEEDVGDSDEDELPVMTASHYQHRVASRGRSLTGADITSSSSELNILGRSPTGVEFASSSSLLDTSSSKDRRASALQARKQKRAERKLGKAPGRPPSGALPEAPDYAKPRLVPSSSEGLHPSTTYGDTRNLLEITQKTGWSAKPSNFANSEYQLSPDRYVPPTAAAPHIDSNNAYNVQSSPEVVVSRASTHSDQFEYDGPNYSLLLHQQNRHRPLERDISNVLRHVSTYSNGSVSSSILRDTAIFQSEAFDPVGADVPRSLTLANTVGTAAESLADDNSLPAEDSAFYAHGALAQDWLDNDRRNVVRVPISQNTKQFDHAAFSRLDNPGASSHLVPRTSEDDGNDWETVGESAFGLDRIANKNPDGMLGGGFRRAGSSLANVSDEGSEHTAREGYTPQLREFSSTERIAQHPATIEYDGSYRQRDLKKTKQPIFLPIYGEHKVNGYLADSSRLRAPPNRFNVQPNPLATQHTNPFSTDPPEVMSNSNPERRHVRQKASGHHLYRYSIDDASIDTDLTEQQVPPVPVRNHNIEPLPLPDITVRTFNWMDQFGDPGPAIGRQEQPSQQKSRQLLRPETPDRPSSWQHVIALANGQPVRGYSPGGTRLQTASPLESHGVSDSNGFTEVPTYGHGANPRGGDKDGDRRTRILNRFNKSKSDRPIGTRGLREISLVEAHRPMTPSIAPAVGRNPNDDVRPNDFSYRSPLAPPKSKEWRRMYRFSQLFKFEKDAKTDGMMELSPLGQDRPSGGSRRHLWEAPRMTPWPRDSSVLPLDLSRRRKNISLTVLLLCNICPPLLVLYAIGRLDGVILWYTRGDISSFGKGQKRAAYFLMGVWGAAVVFGLIIFLVYSLHHN